MPTGLLPDPFRVVPIICLEDNAATCPQRLLLARAIGRRLRPHQKKCNQPYLEPVRVDRDSKWNCWSTSRLVSSKPSRHCFDNSRRSLPGDSPDSSGFGSGRGPNGGDILADLSSAGEIRPKPQLRALGAADRHQCCTGLSEDGPSGSQPLGKIGRTDCGLAPPSTEISTTRSSAASGRYRRHSGWWLPWRSLKKGHMKRLRTLLEPQWVL